MVCPDEKAVTFNKDIKVKKGVGKHDVLPMPFPMKGPPVGLHKKQDIHCHTTGTIAGAAINKLPFFILAGVLIIGSIAVKAAGVGNY